MEKANRRSFLRSLSGCASLSGAALAGTLTNRDATAEAQEPAPLPWPYVTLDIEWSRKRAHQLYKTKECCASVFTTIVEGLVKSVGAPYDTVPCDMMAYGTGGVVGFASLCGALNGACAAISLSVGKEDATKVITELLSWYAIAPFPSDLSNQYARKHEYFEDDLYSIDAIFAQSKAGGNLCHMSVSNWCKKSGFGSGTIQRTERCARLSGDVAAKTVELLNQYHKGTFAILTPLPSEASGCRGCHSKSEESLTRGKMDCTVCHVDPVMYPHDE